MIVWSSYSFCYYIDYNNIKHNEQTRSEGDFITQDNNGKELPAWGTQHRLFATTMSCCYVVIGYNNGDLISFCGNNKFLGWWCCFRYGQWWWLRLWSLSKNNSPSTLFIVFVIPSVIAIFFTRCYLWCLRPCFHKAHHIDFFQLSELSCPCRVVYGQCSSHRVFCL